jgi:hypothetical protein
MRSWLLPQAELMIGIESLFEATISVPSTLPDGVGVFVGFAEGLTVSKPFPTVGNGTPGTASALVQTHPTLNPVAANAATTSTTAPIARARPLPPKPPGALAPCP